MYQRSYMTKLDSWYEHMLLVLCGYGELGSMVIDVKRLFFYVVLKANAYLPKTEAWNQGLST